MGQKSPSNNQDVGNVSVSKLKEFPDSAVVIVATTRHRITEKNGNIPAHETCYVRILL